MLIFITILIVAIASLIVYRQLYENKKYIDIVYLNNLQHILEFNNIINALNDYVSWVQRDKLKTNYYSAGKFFKDKTKFYKKEKAVKIFNEIFQSFDNYIEIYNKNYVKKQKENLREYFDNIEGKVLDEQQRTAIITDEHSNLIIAGAGSGKTLTILGKVKYLVEKKNIKPENILLLSYTK